MILGFRSAHRVKILPSRVVSRFATMHLYCISAYNVTVAGDHDASLNTLRSTGFSQGAGLKVREMARRSGRQAEDHAIAVLRDK